MKNNNEKIWRVLRSAIAIAVILVTVATAYGVLSQKVEQNITTIGKHEQEIDRHAETVIGIKKDIGYIKKSLDRIEKKL